MSAAHALNAVVSLYDHLFTKEHPEVAAEEEDFRSNLSPQSLQVLSYCMVGPGLKDAKPFERIQFS